MMRGANVSTHFEPLHKLKAHTSARAALCPKPYSLLYATLRQGL